MAMNSMDKLKLEVMFDVLTREVEYCLSLAYNNDEDWTIGKRVNDLASLISRLFSQRTDDIVSVYDLETFSKDVQLRVKEEFHLGYKIGDEIKIYADQLQSKIVALEGLGKYGLLLPTGMITNITGGSVDNLISNLKESGALK